MKYELNAGNIESVIKRLSKNLNKPRWVIFSIKFPKTLFGFPVFKSRLIKK